MCPNVRSFAIERAFLAHFAGTLPNWLYVSDSVVHACGVFGHFNR
jgi:hypothetical protein